MLYSYFVEKSIRQSFDDVNHRWDEAVKAVAPHVHHRVSGAHALGGGSIPEVPADVVVLRELIAEARRK
jgi:hypothetical protein